MKYIIVICIILLMPAISCSFDIHERFVMGGVSENIETSLYEIGQDYSIPNIIDLIIVWSNEAGEGYDTEWKKSACQYLKQVIINKHNILKIKLFLARWYYNYSK